MEDRKLASVQEIAEIKSIDGADAIEAVRVNGWWIVAKKGEFIVGDLCIYFEIDSFLPVREEFEFLRKSSYKSSESLGEGFRLKTIRLRKQLSQGLVIHMGALHDICWTNEQKVAGVDVTELLGVTKYEKPLDPCLSGLAKGLFPSFLKKTDQERAQNIPRDIEAAFQDGEEFEVTMKLDGSSITVFYNNGQTGVCSRNLELKTDESNANNTFVKTATDKGLIAALTKLGVNIAVQAELMGPGIQGNRENLKEFELFIFDIYAIDLGVKLSPSGRAHAYSDLVRSGYTGKHAPIMETRYKLPSGKVDDLMALADGPSLHHAVREGKVYKSYDSDFSFKTVSNAFLLKGGD